MFAITYRVANTADFNSRGGTVSLSPDVHFSYQVYSEKMFFSSLRIKPVEVTLVTKSIWNATLSIFAGTVLFLGKAVVLSVLILVLVQFIANTEVCYLYRQVRSRTFQTNWKVS